MMMQFSLQLSSGLILAASMVRLSMAQCGSNCGEIYNYPVFAVIRFNLNDCNLYHSWIMTRSVLTNIERFSADQAANVCSSNFIWISGERHYNWNFKSLKFQLNDVETCSGGYTADFYGTSDDFSSTFRDAKILCNKDDILAILAPDPSSSADYQLYYETDTNYLTDMGLLFEELPPQGGQYCKAMFPLMTDLLRGLKKNSTSFFDSLPTACPTTTSSSSSNTGIMIAAAVCGAILLVVAIGLLIWWRRRNNKNKEGGVATMAQVAAVHDAPAYKEKGGKPDLEQDEENIYNTDESDDEKNYNLVEQVQEIVNADGTRTVVKRTIYTKPAEL